MRRRTSRRVAVAVALLAAAGCGLPTRLEHLVPAADQALAREYFDSLRRGRLDEVERVSGPPIAGPDLRRVLERAAALIPPGEPTSATVTGYHVFRDPDSVTASVTHEYEFDGRWVVAQFTFRRQAGGVSLIGFQVVPNPAPLAELHAFRLRGKSPAQWVILGLAVGLPVFTVYALVACARAGLRGRGWLWLLFVAVGVGRVAVNWTTGAVTASPLYAQLFSASAVRDLNGPWVISVSFPLGAVWYLVRQRRRRAAAAAGPGVAGRVLPEPDPDLPARTDGSVSPPAGRLCPRCGAAVPQVGDAYCPECRQPLSD